MGICKQYSYQKPIYVYTAVPPPPPLFGVVVTSLDTTISSHRTATVPHILVSIILDASLLWDLFSLYL